MKAVGVPFVKKDAKALVTGKPVYTNDLAPKDCLIVKLKKSACQCDDPGDQDRCGNACAGN